MTDPTTTAEVKRREAFTDAQKPLGYLLSVAANRLQNGGACEMVTSDPLKDPAHPFGGDVHRAVFLHPDPDAEKLRARIRVLEAGAQRTGDLKSTLKLEFDLQDQTRVATRLATEHEAMSKTLTAAQDAGTKLAEEKRKLEAELAQESAKVGELQTEVDALKEDRKNLVGRLRDLGVGCAFDARGHVTGTTRAPTEPPVMVRIEPPVNAFPAGPPVHITHACVGSTLGKLRATLTVSGHKDPLWNGTYSKVEKPEPDGCPMPKRVSGWARDGQKCLVWSEVRAGHGEEWRVVVYGDGDDPPYSYCVSRNQGLVAQAPCGTPAGGLRLGVKAARRAWRIRNTKGTP